MQSIAFKTTRFYADLISDWKYKIMYTKVTCEFSQKIMEHETMSFINVAPHFPGFSPWCVLYPMRNELWNPIYHTWKTNRPTDSLMGYSCGVSSYVTVPNRNLLQKCISYDFPNIVEKLACHLMSYIVLHVTLLFMAVYSIYSKTTEYSISYGHVYYDVNNF